MPTTPKTFIAVTGNIGAGKSSLCKQLAQRYSWKPHYESTADNPYLSDFYADMRRWSFPLQIYFLNHRHRTHKAILQNSQSAIQDRTIYEDAHIFARNLHEEGHLDPRDYQNYTRVYESLKAELRAPDLIVYLRRPLSQLQANISRRGREYEQSIPDSYLKNLNRLYDEWMNEYTEGRRVILDVEHRDFVHRPEDFEWVCRQIQDALPALNS